MSTGWRCTCARCWPTGRAAPQPLALFSELLQWAQRTGETDPAYLPWAIDAVSAYLACGRLDDAQQVIDWVAKPAAVLPTRWPKIALATGRAAVAEQRGDRATAEACFVQALELHEGPPMALARVQTLTDYGAFLVRGGGNPPSAGVAR